MGKISGYPQVPSMGPNDLIVVDQVPINSNSTATINLTDFAAGIPGLNPQVPLNFGVVNGGESDIPYMKSIGLNAVRLGSGIGYPWVESDFRALRATGMAFKAAGFFVQYDLVYCYNQNIFSDAAWYMWTDVCVAEAMYCQSIGFIPDLFGTGNEFENLNNPSIMSYQDLYNHLQITGAAIKSAGYTGKITYNFVNNTSGPWFAGGAGSYDAVAFHPYGSITPAVVPLASNQTLNNGSSTIWTSQVPNSNYQYSLSFNGSSPNTNVVLNGSNTTYSSLTDFTWAGWVKVDNTGRGALWSNNYSYGSNLGQTIFVGNGGYVIQLSQGSTNITTNTAYGAYVLNQWFYLVVTQQGSTVNIYTSENGVLSNVVSNATLAPVAQDTQNTTVLGYETDSGSYFAGEMVDVNIWSRCLTSEEISGLITADYPSNGLIGQYLVPSGTVTPAVVDLSGAESVISGWFGALGSKAYCSEFNTGGSGQHMSLTPAQSQAGIASMYSYIEAQSAAVGSTWPKFYYQWSASSFQAQNPYGPAQSLLWLNGQLGPDLQYFLGLGS